MSASDFTWTPSGYRYGQTPYFFHVRSFRDGMSVNILDETDGSVSVFHASRTAPTPTHAVGETPQADAIVLWRVACSGNADLPNTGESIRQLVRDFLTAWEDHPPTPAPKTEVQFG